ncbi:MAG: carbohydrate ABC transporter substrate-binding protein [Rhodospirillaceae bacterium]|nr:carbohydrate ABC transporter substrate-binding protein [Rhodospirillaceae bacterium]MYG51454.1 carbohydrate ABC transporter substrate-binding protein [Rhodospirillaceae bacterium]MYH38101.1 carbohydrate ABC transporter substrate-binding protein [Rhodospirillaceae bacterium]MYK15397.1 carbohydrate ABC transporter substrate-binding protein [Rhodospirillaceae bacterium]MYK59625.1 carbohydrate ABC transporter substrate-binding protein [Rhodospirillaceae bacterium]
MRWFGISVLVAIAAFAASVSAQTTLVLDSWRDDDRAVWEEKIAPAFEAAHPEIRLQFRASAPTDYDTVLKARLAAGTAGDLIACRPFDASLALYDAGHLAGLGDLAGMAHFSRAATSAWQTDDGSVTFCVPVASVIHGFLYNRDAFRRLGLEAPRTEAAFFAVLERLRADGTLVPMALGLRDRWEAATVGYNNIGPAYWKGEEGRRALVAGRQKLTGEPWVAPFRTLARWGRYLGEGYRTRSYRESQDLFAGGGAAIYPSGSWEIAGFRARAGFRIGAFPPPVRRTGDTCHISHHMDMGIGLNAASPNGAAARVFLNWVTSAAFASLHANALPGFFPLADHAVELDDPLARTFLSWRDECRSTVRFASRFLSRGTPNLEREAWEAAVAAIAGTATAEELGARLQKGLAGWYAPMR